MQGNWYRSLDDLYEDLCLMFKNATTFNERGSFIYNVAKRLKGLVTSKKRELESGQGVDPEAGKQSE